MTSPFPTTAAPSISGAVEPGAYVPVATYAAPSAVSPSELVEPGTATVAADKMILPEAKDIDRPILDIKDLSAAVVNHLDMAQLRRDVDTTGGIDVLAELQRHTSIYEFYSGAKVMAKRQYDMVKVEAQIVEDKLTRHFRTHFKASGTKFTEAEVMAEVRCSTNWAQVQQKLIDAATVKSMCDQAVELVQSRQSILVQISSGIRSGNENFVPKGPRRDATMGTAAALAARLGGHS